MLTILCSLSYVQYFVVHLKKCQHSLCLKNTARAFRLASLALHLPVCFSVYFGDLWCGVVWCDMVSCGERISSGYSGPASACKFGFYFGDLWCGGVI